MVNDSELLSIISKGGADIASSCRRLIERANQKGGKDNITAVLAYHE
jgi:serine/threonine protein phosphatase PrpC